MDDLAHSLQLDPLAFRLKNLKDERLRAVLTAAAKQFGWGKAKAKAGHGFGIAGGTENGSSMTVSYVRRQSGIPQARRASEGCRLPRWRVGLVNGLRTYETVI